MRQCLKESSQRMLVKCLTYKINEHFFIVVEGKRNENEQKCSCIFHCLNT